MNFGFVYLDDFLVAFSTVSEDLTRSLVLDVEKWKFLPLQVLFLSYSITPDGVKFDPGKGHASCWEWWNTTVISYPKRFTTSSYLKTSSLVLKTRNSDKFGVSKNRLCVFSEDGWVKAQWNRRTYNPEVLAAYLNIKYFSFTLEGKPFTIFTDHNALTLFLRKKYALANYDTKLL